MPTLLCRKTGLRGPRVDWYQTIFELIDMRSFSNLWYWIALAVMWSSASHYVLGVPFDMVLRAKRQGGESLEDVETLTRVNINRYLLIGRVSGLWLLGFVSFVLTGLGILGFYYGIEFSQAVFLLIAPMSIVGLLTISAARLIKEQNLSGEALLKRLTRHRLQIQSIGMIAIFITALYGMYVNMNVGALGG